jgi:hypothetical protein
MAFSFGTGWCKTYSEGRTPFLLILFGCGYAALDSFESTSPQAAEKLIGQ